jgi:hypothetical protein
MKTLFFKEKTLKNKKVNFFSPTKFFKDDLSVAMKLGPWFNGKNNIIKTMERQTNNRVFPTAVYLDKLDILAAGGSGDKLKTDPPEMIKKQPDFNPQIGLVKAEDDESLSSFDTLRKDPNLLLDPVTPAARPKRSSPYSDPETATTYGRLTEISPSKSKKMNFAKNNSSYSLNKGSKVKAPSKQQVHRKQQMVQRHQQQLEEQGLRRSKRSSSAQNSEAGSFHFLHPDEIKEREEKLAAAAAASSTSTPTLDREQSDIQWSGNSDRLI